MKYQETHFGLPLPTPPFKPKNIFIPSIILSLLDLSAGQALINYLLLAPWCCNIGAKASSKSASYFCKSCASSCDKKKCIFFFLNIGCFLNIRLLIQLLNDSTRNMMHNVQTYCNCNIGYFCYLHVHG